MRVDLSTSELHNLVRRRGQLMTRAGLQSIKTPTAGARYVAGFSVESPMTSEVWHYLVERHSSSGQGTIRVYTEDFLELYSYDLGSLPSRPHITWGVQSSQLMINSQSFSSPVYGLVGGGLIQAVKTESINPDTTALEIPTGIVSTFGDRFAIASGNLVYFNDPGVDPRTFVPQNVLSVAGVVTDMFEGPAGALYIFTTESVYIMPRDALGKGQEVSGFVSQIPGLQTTKPRNAAASSGTVVVLQRNGLQVLGSTEGQGLLDVAPYKGPRYFSESVEVDDYRLAAEVYPTSRGFLLGFRGARSFLLDVDLVEGTRSYVWHQSEDMALVGTLRSREGDTLLLLEDRVVMSRGTKDWSTTTVRGVACLEVDLPEETEVLVRHITTSSDNIGQTVGVYCQGNALEALTPTKADDLVVGASPWSSSRKYRTRQPRTVRHSLAERATHLPLEVVVDGGNRRLEPGLDVEFRGQGRSRRDRR